MGFAWAKARVGLEKPNRPIVEVLRRHGSGQGLYLGNHFALTGGNMKVKIIAGKVYLPKAVRERARLSEEGECELVLLGDEVRLRAKVPETLGIMEALRKPAPELGVKEMLEAEEVDNV